MFIPPKKKKNGFTANSNPMDLSLATNRISSANVKKEKEQKEKEINQIESVPQCRKKKGDRNDYFRLLSLLKFKAGINLNSTSMGYANLIFNIRI